MNKGTRIEFGVGAYRIHGTVIASHWNGTLDVQGDDGKVYTGVPVAEVRRIASEAA